MTTTHTAVSLLWHRFALSDCDDDFVDKLLAIVINEWSGKIARLTLAPGVSHGPTGSSVVLSQIFGLREYLAASLGTLTIWSASYFMILIAVVLPACFFKHAFLYICARMMVGFAASIFFHCITMGILLSLERMAFHGPRRPRSLPHTLLTLGSWVFLLIDHSNALPMILFFWATFDYFLLGGSQNWFNIRIVSPSINISNVVIGLDLDALYAGMFASALFSSFAFPITRLLLRLYVLQHAYKLDGEKLVQVMVNRLLTLELTYFDYLKKDMIVNRNDFERLLEKMASPPLNRRKDMSFSIYSLWLCQRAYALIRKTIPSTESDIVYESLACRRGGPSPYPTLNFFDSIASLGFEEASGEIGEKAQELVKLFCPSFEGSITKEDFLCSFIAAKDDYDSLKSTFFCLHDIVHELEKIVNNAIYVAMLGLLLFPVGITLFTCVPGADLYAFLLHRGLAICFAAPMLTVSKWVYVEIESKSFVRKRNYRIGDLLEFIPNGASTTCRFDIQNIWRVDKITLDCTTLVSLSRKGESRDETNATIFDKHQILIWSRIAATFSIRVRVPLNAATQSNTSLEKFHQDTKVFAQDNLREWFAVKSIFSQCFVEKKNSSELRIEIQHRESWHKYELVQSSLHKLRRNCQGRFAELFNNAISDSKFSITVRSTTSEDFNAVETQ